MGLCRNLSLYFWPIYSISCISCETIHTCTYVLKQLTLLPLLSWKLLLIAMGCSIYWNPIPPSIKPQLHEWFSACGGDVIFLGIVASPVRSVFSAIFSCRHCSTCMRVATCVIFTACWWQDNLRKNCITIASKKLLVYPWLKMIVTARGLNISPDIKMISERSLIF